MLCVLLLCGGLDTFEELEMGMEMEITGWGRADSCLWFLSPGGRVSWRVPQGLVESVLSCMWNADGESFCVVASTRFYLGVATHEGCCSVLSLAFHVPSGIPSSTGNTWSASESWLWPGTAALAAFPVHVDRNAWPHFQWKDPLLTVLCWLTNQGISWWEQN